MKITIITVGSRGDVQPYLALGVGLQQAGYTVRLATHDTFKDLTLRYGLDFFSVGGDIQWFFRTYYAKLLVINSIIANKNEKAIYRNSQFTRGNS
ncbi:MAG: hypothetical protein F6J92_01755 [Symploca sp. SIO1A3]|nr:hypothetical protein [Symploca sp. SIO1A3]